VASVLDQIEKEGKKLTKWELCVVVKELRKCKRFKLALEVFHHFWLLYELQSFEFCLLIGVYGDAVFFFHFLLCSILNELDIVCWIAQLIEW